MKFNTGFYCSSDIEKHDCTTARPIVRPELSFTVKEIAQKFTLHNIIAESQRSNPIYNGDSKDEDFDQPCVNVRPMYDLVDARNDTLRVIKARYDVSEAMKKKTQSSTEDTSSTADNASISDPALTE